MKKTSLKKEKMRKSIYEKKSFYGSCLYSQEEVNEIFRRFSIQIPQPKGELFYINEFTLLVAVVLSARTTDNAVNRATEKLFFLADSPEKILALGEKRIGDFIRTIGLWKSKARHIIALSEILVRDFGGGVPQTYADLSSLPGVGRKTALVVLNVAFGLPLLAVDTHIFRLGNRLGLAPGKTVLIVEENFTRIIPSRYMRYAHHWLILHGRYICKARKPLCKSCIIEDLCKSEEKIL